MIPVFRPSFGPAEIEAVGQTLASGWVGAGPKTAEFERRFAAYVGSGRAVALNSCTAALHLALEACRIKDREVITSPMTFVSTNHAILYNGGIPVFGDIDPGTLCLDPAKIEDLVTDKTKAVVVVHYGGQAYRLDLLEDICRRHDLILVEDCAHACGGSWRGRRLGTFGRFGCFSFHAVKNLATGDGGMVVTDDAEAAARLGRTRWMGIDRDTWSRSDQDRERYSWYYDVRELGFKYQMNDISAALGLVQLDRLEATNARRREICGRYVEAFAGVDWIKTPVYPEGLESSACHNFVIQTPIRDDLNLRLKERGISTGVHYVPNNHYPMYRPFRGPTPVCDQVWKSLLTLPVFPDLTEAELEYVIATILELGKGMVA
jgi:perosamine synthetase